MKGYNVRDLTDGKVLGTLSVCDDGTVTGNFDKGGYNLWFHGTRAVNTEDCDFSLSDGKTKIGVVFDDSVVSMEENPVKLHYARGRLWLDHFERGSLTQVRAIVAARKHFGSIVQFKQSQRGGRKPDPEFDEVFNQWAASGFDKKLKEQLRKEYLRKHLDDYYARELFDNTMRNRKRKNV